MSIGVSSLRSATGNIEDPKTQQAFEELDREMGTTFDGIRRMSHDLHPATLRLLGLAPALRSHCNEVAKRQGVDVQFSSAGDIGAVHPDVAVCFFRIAQESLRNGIVHGGAKHLTVTLGRSGDQLDLEVRRRRTGVRRERGAGQRRRARPGDDGGARQPGRRRHLRRQRTRPRHDGESARPRESRCRTTDLIPAFALRGYGGQARVPAPQPVGAKDYESRAAPRTGGWERPRTATS